MVNAPSPGATASLAIGEGRLWRCWRPGCYPEKAVHGYQPQLRPERMAGRQDSNSPRRNRPPLIPKRARFLNSDSGCCCWILFLASAACWKLSACIRACQHFPLVATAIHGLAFGLAFVTGGARRIATSRTGILVLLFTGWMIACTPFSAWRGGSAQTILYNWTPSLVAFLACGLLYSLRQCRRFAGVLAFSGLTIAVASFFFGRTEQRFSFGGGTLGNANDLAMILLLGAPFFFVPLLDAGSNMLAKIVALPAALLVIGVSFRTGSRAAHLGGDGALRDRGDSLPDAFPGRQGQIRGGPDRAGRGPVGFHPFV